MKKKSARSAITPPTKRSVLNATAKPQNRSARPSFDSLYKIGSLPAEFVFA
jgi:hypothetical protein